MQPCSSLSPGAASQCSHSALLVLEVSYGAPCEQGVSTANTMPLCDMEEPGLIPDVSEVEVALKEAQQGHQHGQRQQCQEVAVSHRERSLVDYDPGLCWRRYWLKYLTSR